MSGFIAIGENKKTGRLFLSNDEGQRLDFNRDAVVSLAIMLNDYCEDDGERGFVRHEWGDLELDWDGE